MASTSDTSIVTIPDSYIQDETRQISQKLQDKKSRLTDIVSELTELRLKGFYNYINKIDPLYMFTYIVLVIIIILLSDYIPWALKHMIGLVIGVVVIYYLNEGNRATHVNKLKTTEIHMEHITPRPSFFHYDANFIEFAYNMLQYRNYNKIAYENMIKSMDHFLELWNDISNPAIINCAETYHVAVDMKTSALNELHSLIHSVPHDDRGVVEKKLMNALKTLQLYLQRHLDDMAEMCNKKIKQKGWNHSTVVIDKYAIPGIDKLKSANYNLF